MHTTESIRPQIPTQRNDEKGVEGTRCPSPGPDENLRQESGIGGGRKNKKRFAAIVLGKQWNFTWDHEQNRLLARKKHSRRVYAISPDTLVDTAIGQLKLL